MAGFIRKIEGDIHELHTEVTRSPECMLISAYLHHVLTPEREKELSTLVEAAIYAVVKRFSQ